MMIYSTVCILNIAISAIFIISMTIETVEGTKGKPSGKDKQEYKSCIEMKNHRCVKETGEMDLEIYACENVFTRKMSYENIFIRR